MYLFIKSAFCAQSHLNKGRTTYKQGNELFPNFPFLRKEYLAPANFCS